MQARSSHCIDQSRGGTFDILLADMGFSLSRETVMCLAFKIVDATQRKHPFKDQKAGCAWFDGFCHRHPKLSIRSPLPLSYCCVRCANMDTIPDFSESLVPFMDD